MHKPDFELHKHQLRHTMDFDQPADLENIEKEKAQFIKELPKAAH